METRFTDQFKRFCIHQEEFTSLPDDIKVILEKHQEFDYVDLLKVDDRVAKAKQIISDYVAIIKKNDGKESNIECLSIDVLIYLMQHMTAQELRGLCLEKLI